MPGRWYTCITSIALLQMRKCFMLGETQTKESADPRGIVALRDAHILLPGYMA